jgi:hypothetical protein
MSEAPDSRGITRRFYYWVASVPFPLSERSIVAPPLLFDSPAASHTHRRPWALRPRLTTGLPFSLAHTDAHACKLPKLATGVAYTESQPYAIPLGGFSAYGRFPHMDDASVLLCSTRCLMHALLPKGDEF